MALAKNKDLILICESICFLRRVTLLSRVAVTVGAGGGLSSFCTQGSPGSVAGGLRTRVGSGPPAPA